MKVDHDKLVKKFLKVKQVNPGRCDPEVYEEGKFLCGLSGPRMWMIEAWVKKVAKLAKTKVDWSFCGGRASVDYIGDDEVYKRVLEAARLTAPALVSAAQIAADRHKEDSENNVWAHPCQWLSVPWGVVSA